ncbi:DNA adenine methylase [Paraburkholderia phenoliruptrix]|uniref:DNA adenine methylase n=1 Tax=Paraburkholderia phenoliruptrix TaxID=252970 RepID=UPI002863C151|nr:Dam family site-specific DNA-(adenine-N6)-methyltransferase [Paraburkholderia phenoliruptrix]MDR6420252.1 DNA adenine methylase [Paraburkholderia phenoliruptrix]
MTNFLPRRIRAKAPPIKIQGIKTKLVPWIADAISWSGHGRWVEPFLGSGAVALNVAAPRALLCDTNEHIIRFYSAIQSGSLTPECARQYLEEEGERLSAVGEDHFYAIRERFNASKEPLDLLFLNRSCFNGIMRFNKKGAFNVPFCRKPERFRQALVTKICNQIAWARKSMHGKDWEFKCQPWRETLKEARPDDFVYLDPPYFGRHTDYYNQWTESEADELSHAIKALPSGFAYSMWKENKYRENSHLLEHFSDYAMETFSHFYHVGSSESLRGEMEEALIISPQNLVDESARLSPPDLSEDESDDKLEQQELFQI